MALTEEQKAKRRAYMQQWRANNPRKQRASYARELRTNAAWREANRERFNSMIRNWKRRNGAALAQSTRQRQAAKKLRAPAWAKTAALKAVYAEARRLTKLTGQLYTVDHIIPLQGLYVSGLHVPENLQVLPANINYAKGNRYDPQRI